MPVQFYNGAILFVDGMIAMSSDCCCSSSSSFSSSSSESFSSSFSSSSSSSESFSSGSSSSSSAEAAPCTCPEGLTGDYRLANYTDGDLAGCTSCPDSDNPAWDGSFAYAGFTDCLWTSYADKSIDGKLMTSASYIELSSCHWNIWIFCGEYMNGMSSVWYGTKDTGDTPAGVYTRTDGCDTTATLTIEEVP